MASGTSESMAITLEDGLSDAEADTQEVEESNAIFVDDDDDDDDDDDIQDTNVIDVDGPEESGIVQQEIVQQTHTASSNVEPGPAPDMLFGDEISYISEPGPAPMFLEDQDISIALSVSMPSPVLPTLPSANSQPKRAPCAICTARHQRGRSHTLRCGHTVGKECMTVLHKPDAPVSGEWSKIQCPTCSKEVDWFDRLLVTGCERHMQDARVLSSTATSTSTTTVSKRKRVSLPAAVADDDVVTKGVVEAAALLDRVGTQYHNMIITKNKKTRVTKVTKAQAKTAWSKGTGYGGARVTKTATAAVAKAQERQVKEDREIVTALANLAAFLKTNVPPILPQHQAHATIDTMSALSRPSTATSSIAQGLQPHSHLQPWPHSSHPSTNSHPHFQRSAHAHSQPHQQQQEQLQPQPTDTPTPLVMALQYLLETSPLVSLLRLLLRNDSLMDILGNHADLYDALTTLLEVIVSTPAFCGLVDEACLLKSKVNIVKAQQQLLDPQASTKKRSLDDASESNETHDDVDAGGDTVGILKLLEDMNRQCKLFVKQCKNSAVTTTGDGVTTMDPSGIAGKMQNLYTLAKERVASRDPQLRDQISLQKKSDAEVEGSKTTLPGEKQEKEYLESMKPLQFRMVKMDLATHGYRTLITQSLNMTVRRERLKRITREMSSLSSALPFSYSSSIFVRVDESRPDVLKALIIGPEGTPYANGCFEFDIFLPIDYPQSPPKVILLTTSNGKVRFNPNLYANGKVCLSLLGTWEGPGWDAATSTLLQVLISIQSCIMVDNPYFNEPGFETRPGSETSSNEYNQSIQYYTMSVAMVGALRSTCSEFKAVVQTHFRLKRDRILEQCMQWASQSKPPGAAAAAHNFFLGVSFAVATGEGGHHGLPFMSPDHVVNIYNAVRDTLSSLTVEQSITIL